MGAASDGCVLYVTLRSIYVLVYRRHVDRDTWQGADGGRPCLYNEEGICMSH